MTLVIGLMASIAFYLDSAVIWYVDPDISTRRCVRDVRRIRSNECTGVIVGCACWRFIVLCLSFESYFYLQFIAFRQPHPNRRIGWITTLIATPANEWVVKLVTTNNFRLSVRYLH
eukprot:TRINITY_DN5850_c0_g1_i1.p1 TRINITY_DN5850_c0_g1~~TRINITY_DN5850_c0_g1_i1.p1  ORF type:complete len:116 (-),score=0.75 TRINITY_DN5850_c0_g1_i1:220-567(-)